MANYKRFGLVFMGLLSACGTAALLWAPPADDTGVCATGVDKRVFITSGKRNGNFGGYTGADEYCQTLAGQAGLGGEWTAYVTITGRNAKDRLRVGVSAWKLIDGTTVFTSTCTLPEALVDVNIDENGAVVNDIAWTGAASNGEVSTGGTCNEWTSSDSSKLAGVGTSNWNALGYTNTEWAARGFSSCAQPRRLYCFER